MKNNKKQTKNNKKLSHKVFKKTNQTKIKIKQHKHQHNNRKILKQLKRLRKKRIIKLKKNRKFQKLTKIMNLPQKNKQKNKTKKIKPVYNKRKEIIKIKLKLKNELFKLYIINTNVFIKIFKKNLNLI